MIDPDDFKHVDAMRNCNRFAYTVDALVRAGRLALENETSGEAPEQKDAAVATVLDVVEAMMAVIIDGTEACERQLKVGVWAPKENVA